MSDPLYERYKEALRAGHVALLRGRLDEAIESYRAAAEVAPERALPHTSLGGVLLDLGRADDALAEFHAALAISPGDEGALIGRSEALVRMGQPITAAETLDTLAGVLLAAGRDADAVETLQRALVLEERTGRRRQYQRALRSLRMSSGDRASDEALGRALGILDAPAGAAASEPEIEAASPATAAAPEADAPAALAVAPAVDEPAEVAQTVAVETAEAEQEPSATDEVVDAGAEAVEAAQAVVIDAQTPDAVSAVDAVDERVAAVEAAPVPGATPVPEVAPVVDVVEPPAPPDPRKVGETSLTAAVAALAAGDSDSALAAYCDAARVFLAGGLLIAALDACRDAVQIDPDDVDVHLLYAAIFRARGWRDLATSRIVNLLRLVDLDGDSASRARICADIESVHAEDDRLAGLCR